MKDLKGAVVTVSNSAIITRHIVIFDANDPAYFEDSTIYPNMSLVRNFWLERVNSQWSLKDTTVVSVNLTEHWHKD